MPPTDPTIAPRPPAARLARAGAFLCRYAALALSAPARAGALRHRRHLAPRPVIGTKHVSAADISHKPAPSESQPPLRACRRGGGWSR